MKVLTSHERYSFPDLLAPQFDLQINLRFPDFYYTKVPRLPAALTKTIDLLVSHAAPFHLFYNYTTPKPAALLFRPPRHIQNEVAWLVFITLQTKSDTVEMVYNGMGYSGNFT